MAPSRRPNPAPPLPGREPLPSRNKQVLESMVVWMKEKTAADGARQGIPPHLWAVHGKLYDLANYAEKHPGGASWITMTQGADVSEAFETHHLNAATANAVLAKYYIRDCTSATPVFTFDPKGFYATLKTRVFDVLGKDSASRRPTLFMKTLCAGTLVVWAALFAVMCLSSCWALSVAASVAAGVFLHGLFGVGHNFFHQPDSLWMYVFDLSLYSHRLWRISHAYSHHLFPNLDIDFEASTVEPFLRYLSNRPRNTIVVNVTLFALGAFGSMMSFLRRTACQVLRVEAVHPENVLPFLELAACCWSQGALPGLLLWAIMHAVMNSMVFLFSFAVHRTEHVWTAGDSDAKTDFGAHIVATTTDHTLHASLSFSLIAFALLNSEHALHHMFPTVDHSRLRELRPVFEATMKEFGIKYRPMRFGALWLSMLRRHDLMVPPPAPEDVKLSKLD